MHVMRMTSTAIFSALFGAALFAGGTTLSSKGASQPPSLEQCGKASAPQLRTTLYFGTARPKGSVSELEWQLFLRDEVTKRFPEGLTVWDAEGQWKSPAGSIDHERSKVLLLVHPDTAPARALILEVIAKYRQAFDQESVLWETARVCVAS